MSQKQRMWGHKSFRGKNKTTKEAQNFTYLWFEVNIGFFVLYDLVSLSFLFFPPKYLKKKKKKSGKICPRNFLLAVIQKTENTSNNVNNASSS